MFFCCKTILLKVKVYVYKVYVLIKKCKDLSYLTFDTFALIRSATSIRQLGHHVVSTVVCHLLHPDCCCIRDEMVDQGLS